MKSLLFIAATLFFLSVSGQQNPAVTSKSLYSVHFVLPGVEMETGLSQNTTLDLRLGTGFGYASGMFRETAFGVYPNFTVQYRYYYNLAKRVKEEKDISYNSADYFALNGGLYGGDPLIGDLRMSHDISSVLALVWGLQRTYNGGFKLDFNLGGGLGFEDNGKSFFAPLMRIRLGWLLTK